MNTYNWLLVMGHKMSPKMAYKFDDLKTFKVLKIIDSKVMLVFNTSDFKYYVIKVLQKSPCPIDANRKTTVAFNVPYMVKLYKYFENEDSIFLVLEFAKGGKLWNHLIDYEKIHCLDGEYQTNNVTIKVPYLENYKVSGKTKGSPKQINNFNNNCEGLDVSQKSILSLDVAENDIFSGSKTLSKVNKIATYHECKAVESNDENYIDLMEKINGCNVPSLVENSQKLLNSVDKTIRANEKLTSNLNREIMDLESFFESKCQLMHEMFVTESNSHINKKIKQKRSKSANAILKLEKCFSSEDLSECKGRTSSKSRDRKRECLSSNSKNSFFRVSESIIRIWAAEILVALETLHRYNIIFKDLSPSNILVDDCGSILLTFQSHWKDVDSVVSEEAVTKFYTAPEILSVFPITCAVDWWSFGALLHELFTGKSLYSCYPEGISAHTILTFPEFLSFEASSLLKELLKYEPGERLGSGANGVEDIKYHPFFDSIDWQLMYDRN